MSGSMEVSRRTFLKAGAVGALSAGTATTAATGMKPELPMPNEGKSFSRPGNPSRKAYRTFAEDEYRWYQQMREGYERIPGPDDGRGQPTEPNFSQTLNAVEDLGCDPTGNRPILRDINDIPDDTLIVFPPGTYLLPGFLTLNGKHIGMVGKGYEQNKPPTSRENAAVLKSKAGTHAGVDITSHTGLFGNFVFDMTADNSTMQLRARTTGFLQSKDVVWSGVVDTVGSRAKDQHDYLCYLEPQNEAAVSRATRFSMKHNGLPGTKNIGAKSGFWVGVGCKGTAQIEHCTVVGNATNAIYGGRTPGNTQIKGGFFKNNEVSNNRFSGENSWSDGATIVIHAEEYSGPTWKWDWGEHIATSGIEIDRGDSITKPAGAVVRNVDIRVRSVGSKGMRAGIAVLGNSSSLKVENSRVAITISERSVSAEAPGEGYDAPAQGPPPYNVTVDHCLFEGTNAAKTIVISGRPNSLIRNSCISIPGASAEKSISGMRIGKNVGFGKNCQSGGLKNPKKVGSPGPLPSVPIPNNPDDGGGGGGNGDGGLSTGILVGVVNGIFMFLFVLFGMVVLFIAGILGALGAFAAMLTD